MAKIILGATVTAIVGSIGGNTFKRTPYGFSLGRKSFGYSRNKLLSNPALGFLAQVRNDWNNLSSSERTAWNDKASLYPMPDRFGNLITLSGRMLFIKAWGTLIQTRGAVITAADFNTSTDFFEIEAGTIDILLDTVEVEITSTSAGQWYFFQVQRVKSINQQPSFTRRFVCRRDFIASTFTANLYLEMTAQFGELIVGDCYRVYVTPVNVGGYAGVPLTVAFEIAPT